MNRVKFVYAKHSMLPPKPRLRINSEDFVIDSSDHDDKNVEGPPSSPQSNSSSPSSQNDDDPLINPIPSQNSGDFDDQNNVSTI